MLVTLAVAVVLGVTFVGLRLGMRWSGRRLTALGRRVAARALGSRALAAARPLHDLFAHHYPRPYRALRNRLRVDHFAGFPLTLLTAAAVYMAALFGGLIDELLEAEEMVRLDEAINAALDPIRVAPLLDIFLWITDLGASPTVTAVAIMATAFLWISRQVPAAAGLWVTVLGSQATTHTGKALIGRARPEFLDVVSESSAAFPSGHATAAMAIYGFIAYALARAPIGAAQRFEIAYWSGVVIALIGLSRMILRVHFLSDVAGGFLVGGFWLLVGVTLTEWLRQRVRK